jgi:hypothetical protein
LGAFTIWLAVIVGMGGVALNAAFIWAAMQDDKRALSEMLQLDVGVSAAEASIVQNMKDLDKLLLPISERFGPEKRKQVESFLRLETQMGLKRKAQQLSPDQLNVGADLGVDAIELKEELDRARREIGVYCMIYVRSILPPPGEPIWERLAAGMVDKQPLAAGSLWKTLEDKIQTSQQDG